MNYLIVGCSDENAFRHAHTQVGDYQTLFLSPEDEKYKVADLQSVYSFLEEAGEKAVVIEKSETLSEACQNKLLKVLEDGGADFFLFASSKEPFLPTVLSRVQLIYEGVQKREISYDNLLLSVQKGMDVRAFILDVEHHFLDVLSGESGSCLQGAAALKVCDFCEKYLQKKNLAYYDAVAFAIRIEELKKKEESRAS